MRHGSSPQLTSQSYHDQTTFPTKNKKDLHEKLRRAATHASQKLAIANGELSFVVSLCDALLALH
jgi:hypothetical protein